MVDQEATPAPSGNCTRVNCWLQRSDHNLIGKQLCCYYRGIRISNFKVKLDLNILIIPYPTHDEGTNPLFSDNPPSSVDHPDAQLPLPLHTASRASKQASKQDPGLSWRTAPEARKQATKPANLYECKPTTKMSSR